jgi:NAD(P)-dependent dehydrogenase (short-subunit alcohol dehydrogenase family)
MFRLEGKRALVTGGTSGIGLAIVRAFAQAGAEVVAASENPVACAKTENDLRAEGLNVHGVVCDVSERQNIEVLVADCQDQIGGIDILVCNAGIEGPIGAIGSAATEDHDRLFRINLDSSVWLAGLIAPEMAAHGGGAIILMSSLSALRGNKMIGSYAMTKAALAQLARNLAVEWGAKNIRANAIAPGLIETAFAAELMKDQTFMTRRLASTPLGRVGQPDEIAATALYLASDAGAFTTGQTIVVDGGTIINDGS